MDTGLHITCIGDCIGNNFSQVACRGSEIETSFFEFTDTVSYRFDSYRHKFNGNKYMICYLNGKTSIISVLVRWNLIRHNVHKIWKTWAEKTACDWRWKSQRLKKLGQSLINLENTGEINQVLKVFENEDCGCCKYDDEKWQRVLYNNIISSIKQKLNTVNDSKFIVHF